jgi:osmoprotectant transport system ATP-binding protein
MIEFRNVSLSYGNARVFEGFNFTIARGEFITVVGPSGSGKSTLVRMVNRMVPLQGGAIYLQGVNTADMPERDVRLHMGYALQGVGLFPHWSVARNIGTVPALLGWKQARIDRRVDELLQLFQLEPAEFRARFAHQLSGGQAQRVGVARALAADPDVLLMDEPFGALDPITRAALRLEMKRVHAVAGKTTIMVTHDIEEALALGTRVLVLQGGKLVQVATPLELITRPATPWVADFLGQGDLGLKALALQTVASRMQRVAAVPAAVIGAPSDVFANVGERDGATVAVTASLREAVSLMAQHQVSRLQVVDAQGGHVGQLHISDVVAP